MAHEFFQLLKKEHKEVKAILKQLKESKNDREELFQELTLQLVPHMKAEEKTFYQPLTSKEEAREHALEGIEEHHVAEMVFKELQKMEDGDGRWDAKLSVFTELVEHHIKEEEGSLMKSAEKALDDEEIDEIMRRFEQEKKRIKKNLQ